MKPKPVFLIAALLAFSAASAQVSTTPTVIASTGGFATYTGGTVSYTVGESVVTTASSTSNILTQGFQQPGDIVSGLLDLEKQNGISLTLYPIPATTQLWFGYQFNQAGKVEIAVNNVLGQPLGYTLAENYDNGKVVHELNCSTYPAGTYLLTTVFTAIDNSKQTITRRFQIIR